MKKDSKKSKIIPKMWRFLRPYKYKFLISQIAMMIGTACALFIPAVTKSLFDGALTTDIFADFFMPLLWIGVLAAGDGVFGYISSRMLGSLSERVTADVRLKIFARLQQKSLNYHSLHNTGESVSGMTNDINLFQQALTTGLSYIIKMLLSLIISIVLMVVLDPVLTGVFFATVPLMLWITKSAGSKAHSISTKVQQRLSRLTEILGEGLGGISIIKAFNLERHANKMFSDENSKLLDNSLKLVKVRAKTGFLMGVAGMLQLIVMLAIGGWRVSGGVSTAGTLVAFMLYAQGISSPLKMISGIYIDIQRAMTAAERIFSILEDRTVVPNPKKPVQPKEYRGRIEFAGVDFSYDGKENVLDAVSFEARPDTLSAFVGPSGAGKSTLFKLIPRFFDTSAGIINLDGVDIKKMDIKTLREKIAIVPQDTYLFAMSIYDNISCGKPDATTDEVYRAAKMANAHEFIVNLPEGYDTVAGERGARLSGGQRQRIAIARAFLKNPLILLLDEATSALDNNSEKKVQQAISHLMHGRTTLVIAHRLSTVRDADIIHVMDNGKITAFGSHEELIGSNLLYKELYTSGFQDKMEDAG